MTQGDLLLPPTAAASGHARVDEMVQLDEMHREVFRELETRRRVYPQWVRDGRLQQDVADHRIRVLERLVALLQQIERHWERRMPERIQRRRVKGWLMPPSTIYVGRPTKWGNPFTAVAAIEAGYKAEYASQMAVYAYREWLRGNPYYPGYELLRDHVLTNIDDLRGANLACWCPLDQPCHADILLELANV